MILKNIHVRGYKALADLELELPRFGAFVGPNDSGKTSLLEAVQLGANLAQESPCHLMPTGWPAELITGGGPSIESSPLLEIGWLQDAHSTPSGLKVLLQKPPGASWFVQIGSQTMGPIGPSSVPNQDCAIRIYQLIPERLKAPSGFQSAEERMSPDGAKLASTLYFLLGSSRAQFNRVEERLRTIIPTIEDIVVGPASVPGMGVVGQGLWFNTRAGKRVPAAHVSDGAILLLGYLTLMELEGSGPLLLEEPETGIHPLALQSLVDYLRKAVEISDELQVLMTTHSPYLLDHLKPEEVILTRRGEDGFTQAVRMSDVPDLEQWTSIMSPGEIWTSGGEDDLIRRTLKGAD